MSSWQGMNPTEDTVIFNDQVNWIWLMGSRHQDSMITRMDLVRSFKKLWPGGAPVIQSTRSIKYIKRVWLHPNPLNPDEYIECTVHHGDKIPGTRIEMRGTS